MKQLNLDPDHSRWMDCDWLDGPMFVVWCRQMGFLPPEYDAGLTANGSQNNPSSSLARRIWDWTTGGRSVTVWSADRILTDNGGHISMIPDDVWRDKPKRKQIVLLPEEKKREAVALAKETRNIAATARKFNVSRRSVAKWVKSASLNDDP